MNRKGEARRPGPVREDWRFYAGFLWRSLLILSVLSALTLGGILLLDHQRFISQRETALDDEVQRLDAIAMLLAGDLEWVVGRSRALAGSEILRAYFDRPSALTRARLAQEMVGLASHVGLYEAIRLLGRDGSPLVHVEYAQGEARLHVPDEGEPPPQTMPGEEIAGRLRPGELYVSPMLPAWEDRAARVLVAVPVLDSAGAAQATLILHYPAEILLGRLRLALRRPTRVMVVNEDGSALVLAGSSGSSAVINFASRYPDAWPLLEMLRAGAVATEAGMIAFSTMSVSGQPYREHLIGPPEGPTLQQWKLVNWLSPDVYRYEPMRTVDAGPEFAVLLAMLLAGVSLSLGWMRTSNVIQARNLAVSEERLNLALEGASEGHWDYDIGRDRLFISERCREILGCEARTVTITEVAERVHPDDRASAQAHFDGSLHGADRRFVGRFRLRHRDGRWIWVDCRGRSLFDSRDKAVRQTGTLTDVSTEMAAEEKLRQAAAVFDSTTEAIIIMDRSGQITAVNRAFVEITGFSVEEAVGRTRELLASGHEDELVYAEIDRSLAASGFWRGEMRARRKSGEIFPILINVSVVRSPAGRVQHFVALLSDISTLKSSQEQLDRLAHHDALTGLANRLLFSATLEQALHRAQRHCQYVGLLFLDLDRFKLINDTLGHASGDQLLQVMAARLKAGVRNEDTVARLGGDEFTIILEELEEPGDAAAPAEKLLELIQQPVVLGGTEITPSTSIGISIYPAHAITAEELMKAADAAMYRAKQLGRGTYQFFTEDLTAQAMRRMALEEALRRALHQGEFVVLYQPQVSMEDCRLTGVEALLRWQHPKQGLLAPAEFLSVAEESGLIEPVGEWLLEQVCRQALEWRRLGLQPLRVAVNLSPRQLTSTRYLRRIAQVVQQMELAPGELQLDLEVSENALESVDGSLGTLLELKGYGVGLAIDDFGTGRSSLSSLKRLPIDLIKIDRSFVHDLPRDSHSQAIARAIIALARSLQLKVLAEGVETEAQLAFLRAEHCEEAQGFLFSGPVDAEQITDLLRAGRSLAPVRS
jgi:diguanylate cyclase (GGDEF)-like protein/PAS domain S-box-containing protein